MKGWWLFVTLLLTAGPGLAEEIYAFETDAQRQIFKELTEELRCPKCQNQNIADSDALVAQDLKRKVHELMQQGYDKQQVIDYMKQRYGDFVYYQPPLSPATVWLWLGPLLFILLAAAVLVWRRRSAGNQLDPELLARADKWLEKDK
ncbi:cytochrome c-type biogenesis protein [Bowmanella dokdonensis]|uniref:Cytochrome c-type biogenesis protein n=1 Tax=Bowmanella dokdonensis TaxID=751969 RepID=A0A939IRQ5_9ALTE|nr:cytochrome c-type biogenesis protein [Bowmanella dokdonensis]MBN7826334.1 cytochrome c-type biogenesis protein CcmH [Bowmanella dokdonensis]